jgi:hypothetical protein
MKEKELTPEELEVIQAYRSDKKFRTFFNKFLKNFEFKTIQEMDIEKICYSLSSTNIGEKSKEDLV